MGKRGKTNPYTSLGVVGGIPCNGLSAYVEEWMEFESNLEFGKIIEKEAEDFYRTINYKKKLPASNTVIKQRFLIIGLMI